MAFCEMDMETDQKMRWDENFDNIGEYFFESDHLALKGNPDYHNLLKCIVMLEAQRSQAICDLDALHKSRQQALADPLSFVERLQKKEPMKFPPRQRVEQLPTINWNKYALYEGGEPPVLRKKLQPKKLESFPKEEEPDKVRGRAYNPSKPATFNKLWTTAEQKKLEELLIIYPPEEVEFRRWEKISKALGTRTPAQVASRVQKYFIHLSKAGLAVPGRAPRRNTVMQSGRGGAHRVTMLRMTSSFFRHHMPSVYMLDRPDDDDFPCQSLVSTSPRRGLPKVTESEENNEEEEGEDESLAEGGLWENPLYQELLYLQKLKEEKTSAEPLVQHIGFKCDRCQCDPIVGARWHCTDCPSETSVDFCSDCVDCKEEIGTHKSTHHLQMMKQTTLVVNPFLDGGYMHLMGSGQHCNYLDPNYMPATAPV